MIKEKSSRHISITNEKMLTACEDYMRWRIRYISHPQEQMSLPEEIAIPLACYNLSYIWRPGNEEGNALDPVTGKPVEMRVLICNNDDFSKITYNTKLEALVLLLFNVKNDYLCIYKINIDKHELLEKINKTHYEDAKKEFAKDGIYVSMSQLFLKKWNLKPNIIFDIKRRTQLQL